MDVDDEESPAVRARRISVQSRSLLEFVTGAKELTLDVDEGQMRFCRDPTVRRQVAAKLFEDGDDTSVLSLPFPREMVKNADYLGSGKVRVQVTDTRGRDLLSTTWFESQFLQVTIRSLKGRVLFQYGCENIQDDLLHQWRRFVIWMGIAAVYRLTQRLEKAATQPAAPSRKPAAQPSASPKRKRSSVTSGTKPKLPPANRRTTRSSTVRNTGNLPL